MEHKKVESRPVSTGSFHADSQKSAFKASAFLGDVKAEFWKINWTEKGELIAYTKIVVGATFFFGLTIFVMDLFIQGVMGSLSSIVQLIFG